MYLVQYSWPNFDHHLIRPHWFTWGRYRWRWWAFRELRKVAVRPGTTAAWRIVREPSHGKQQLLCEYTPHWRTEIRDKVLIKW